MDQSIIAAGIDFLANIGRDLPLLVVGGIAVGGALFGWRAASKRAEAAEHRLDDIDRQLEGPSTRELCGELAKIITPYREGTFGKPIEDRLPPERRFLRNLRVQLRLSRQRRQRIEAMHAANFAECTRLREELESIRQAADEAASAIARVTMMPGPAATAVDSPPSINDAGPATVQPSKDDAELSDATQAVGDENTDSDMISANSTEAISSDSANDASVQSSEAVDDDVADLVFSALDVPALDELPHDNEKTELDPLAIEIDAADESPRTVDADEEPIDFDSLLAESVAQLGGPSPDDESLGGVAAFEKQLADAGFGPDDPNKIERTDDAADEPLDSIAESPVENEPVMGEPACDSAEQVVDEFDVDVVESPDDTQIVDEICDDDSGLQTAAASCDDAESDSKKKLTPDEAVEPDACPPTPADSEIDASSDASPTSVEAVADASTPSIVTDELGFHQGIDDVFCDIDALMTDEIADAEAIAAAESEGEAQARVEDARAVAECDAGACETCDDAVVLDVDVDAIDDESHVASHADSSAIDAASMNLVEKTKADIAAAIERADRSRQALETLDESLNDNLAHRREMFSKIDSALAERQIQLVTDILRAEAEHLSLTEALNQIRASVDVMQTDVSRLLGGNAGEGTNPPKQ
ncbi:MAG: hypothetical protein H6819_12295 [Phycisphaerales bacterium]|nr:hypothetical protein [Phycisphaerales bacterium]MCB9857519.1 hypothetical protein [Phycisphaerales bacterium]MCB9864496.1 hypothetical protein [Phycisphaerales bacterium]